MKVKSLALGAAAVLVTVSLSACSSGGDSGGDDGSPFRVYANLALTGSLSAQSVSLYEGMQAAATEINKLGGIDGHPIELSKADDQLDPTKAVTLLQQQLTSSNKPNLVWHGQTSNQALALLPLLSRNKILSFGTASSSKINQPDTYPYGFAITTSFQTDASVLVPEIQRLGAKKIGFLCANDAYGQSTLEVYKPVLEAAGLDVTYEQFDPKEIDFSSHIQRLLAANPDLLVNAATQTAGARALQARTESGTTVPMLTTTAVGNGLNLGLTSAPKYWQGVTMEVYKANSSENTPNEGTKLLFSDLRAANSKLDQVMMSYALPWDFLWSVKYAADQAGSIDPDELADALENPKPVSDSMIATFPGARYTADNHFPTLPDAAKSYTFIKPGPVVDGYIQSID